MDKITYTKTITRFLFGLRIFDTVERYTEVAQENVQQYELKVTPEYYNAEFNINNDQN